MAGAEEGEYPHQVKFDMQGSCGGTVYNSEWIITAAHCVRYDGTQLATIENSKIIAGRANVEDVDDENIFTLDQIIVHHGWIDTDLGNGYDIALLHLSRPLPLQVGKIQPLRLVDANYEIPYGSNGITIGWGVAGKLGGVSHLKEFEVPIHHPTRAAQLSLDTHNAGLTDKGVVPHDHILGVAGADSGYSMLKHQKPNLILKISKNILIQVHFL